MARRKRLLLLPCVLVAAVVGLIVWASSGSKPSVSISFIGYTNVPMTPLVSITQPTSPNASLTTLNAPARLLGVVRVTNTGPVAIYLWSVSPAGMVTDKDIPL